MGNFITGANAMAFAVVGLFFLRFWRTSGDRLFAIFAVSFWLLGLTRVGILIAGGVSESNTMFYIVRLAAYLLILIAIVDKNRFWRRKEGHRSEETPVDVQG